VVTKAELRRELMARRDGLPDREQRASQVRARVAALPEFIASSLISSYVGVGAEVPTVPLLEWVMGRLRPVAVPWVGEGELHLTLIHSLGELQPAPFGLLEPRPEIRAWERRRIDPAAISLFLVPGLGFDRRGGRLGFGKGYYDRLLHRAGTVPLRVGLSWEAQLVDQIPMNPGDERMDLVVTEEAVYRVSGRTASAVP
jgi:5-formyltetrahydrofolate cyclo-ligase